MAECRKHFTPKQPLHTNQNRLQYQKIMSTKLSLKKFKQKILKPFKYLIIGGLATTQYLGILYLLTELGGLDYQVSNLISFPLSTTTAFFAHKYITFQNHEKKHAQQFSIFFTIAITGLGINIYSLRFFVEKMHLWYMLAAIITSGIVFIWNFILNNLITFRQVKP